MSEPAGSDELRVGTQEREDAIKILGDHLAAGRLPMDEYEQRVTAAIEAQTRGELRPLFRDLPAPYPPFMVPAQASVVPVYPPHNLPVPYSDKSKIAAGLLQIMLPFGVGRFYTGHTHIALAQLFTVFIGVGVIWSLIDGVLLLVNGGTDGEGRQLRN